MLDVLCLRLLHNSVPMAALTKERPITFDKNIYTKKTEYTKSCKNNHYTNQYKCSEPLLQRHRNPDINYNKKQFKEEKHSCHNNEQVPDSENGRKDNQVPIKKYDEKM
jgi:hypothetical protein